MTTERRAEMLRRLGACHEGTIEVFTSDLENALLLTEQLLGALKKIAYARPAGATPKLVKGELIERIEAIALDAIEQAEASA